MEKGKREQHGAERRRCQGMVTSFAHLEPGVWETRDPDVLVP